MRQYIFSSNGNKTVEGIEMEKALPMEKTVTQYGGEGEEKYLYGSKVLVDPAGIVLRGPDLFIGRTYDDLKNLNYNDVFTVERSIMRAMGSTNKSYNPDDPSGNIERDAIATETKEWLEKTIAIRKKDKQNQSVGHDPLYTYVEGK